MAQDVTKEVTGPANGGEAVDISSADHTATTYGRGLYVGSFGDVVLVTRNGTALTFTNVQDGTLLPVRVKTITKALTTASSMVIVW